MKNIRDGKHHPKKQRICSGPERKPVTLIVGLQCRNAVVIAAEMEEAAGITAKRQVYKLRRISGQDWTVVVGGAGGSAVIENVTRRLESRLAEYESKALTEERLISAIDGLLEYAYDRYIDPDTSFEGLALVVGVSSGNEQYLVKTEKRTPYIEPTFACAGIGVDLGVYFLDRLHNPGTATWDNGVNVATFVLKEAKEAAQNCGIGSEAYVLQSPPRPRWLWMGEDVMNEVENRLPWWDRVLGTFREELIDSKFSPATFGDEYAEEPIQDSSVLKLSRQVAEAAERSGIDLRQRLSQSGCEYRERSFARQKPYEIREILEQHPEEQAQSAPSGTALLPAPEESKKRST